MTCFFSVTALSFILVHVSSSSCSDNLCTDPPQSQPGVSLLQARHSSATKRKSAVTVNPSGAGAPLDETGYAAVADRCCQAEMKVFIERQIKDMGYEVCERPGLDGIVPYHSCERGVQTFDALTSNILQDSGSKCPWVASVGACKALDPSCPTFAGVTPLSDCGCNLSQAVLLDFEKAVVLQNNLGGRGPDTGVAEIRYGGIGEYPAGQPFDLVVAAFADGYAGSNKDNGKALSPKFGRLSVYGPGASKAPANWDGNAKLQLSFVRPGSATPVILPEFFFALFDVDAAHAGAVKQAVSGIGYKGYVTDMNTALVASKNADGSTKFTAAGEQVPNPEDPMTATQEQRQNMVMYFYENMSSFELELGVENTGENLDADKWFLFAGNSALSNMCEA